MHKYFFGFVKYLEHHLEEIGEVFVKYRNIPHQVNDVIQIRKLDNLLSVLDSHFDAGHINLPGYRAERGHYLTFDFHIQILATVFLLRHSLGANHVTIKVLCPLDEKC